MNFYPHCATGHWHTDQPTGSPCYCFVTLEGSGVPDSFVGTGDTGGGPGGAPPPTPEECCSGTSDEFWACQIICAGETREFPVSVGYSDVNCVSCWTHVWPLGPCSAGQCYACAQAASDFEQSALNGTLKLTCKLALCANVCP